MWYLIFELPKIFNLVLVLVPPFATKDAAVAFREKSPLHIPFEVVSQDKLENYHPQYKITRKEEN